jgi:hypothetical protein
MEFGGEQINQSAQIGQVCEDDGKGKSNWRLAVS